MQKLVVLGLDGADWRVLQPEIDAGRLPVLAKLQAEGSYGRLDSTIRPESSVAWSTFATGVNPGKHGVFGFVRHQPNSYKFSLANSHSLSTRCFWDYLGDAGYRVGLLNIPFTYPPKVVNGFLVSGMLTPGAHVSFTYPVDLQERLMARFQPLMFDAGDGDQEKTAVANRVSLYTHQQLEMAKWLLRNETWDCFSMVFTGLDRLQHFAWGGTTLQAHLEQLDKAVGEILDMLPMETAVILMSDHGFAGVDNRLNVNSWLQAAGYLALHPEKRFSLPYMKWLSNLKKVPFATWFKRRFLPENWGPTQLRTAAFGQQINWQQTKAYYAPDGGLRINLQGREPQGVVSQAEYESISREIIEKLQKLRDARNGQQPLAKIYRRDQLYQGAQANHAPDIILEPQRDNPLSEDNYILDGTIDQNASVFQTSHPYNGNHATQGIFLAWAPGRFAQQKIKNVQLQDLAPTIMAMYNTPIPNHMDGRFLKELFVANGAPTPTFYDDPHYDSNLSIPQINEPDIASEDIATVEDRLRKLGYLD